MCVSCFQVNPAENRADISDGKWDRKDASVPSQRAAVCRTPENEVSLDGPAVTEDAQSDLRGNPCTRKSSKAKRVKDYLKKCKDAALGNSSSSHGEPEEAVAVSATDQRRHEGVRVRNSKRRSNSGQREVSSTSWYVAPNLDPPPNNVSVVEVTPPEETDKANSAVVAVVCDSAVTEDQACPTSHLNENGLGDVLDSRNEGGTTVVCLESQEESVPSCDVMEDSIPADESLPLEDDPADTAHHAPAISEVSTFMTKLISLLLEVSALILVMRRALTVLLSWVNINKLYQNGKFGSVTVATEDCVTSCGLVEIYRRFGVAYYANGCCATNWKVAGSIPAGVSGFFIDIKSFRSHYGPGVDSASNRNEYQDYFLGVKADGA